MIYLCDPHTEHDLRTLGLQISILLLWGVGHSKKLWVLGVGYIRKKIWTASGRFFKITKISVKYNVEKPYLLITRGWDNGYEENCL